MFQATDTHVGRPGKYDNFRNKKMQYRHHDAIVIHRGQTLRLVFQVIRQEAENPVIMGIMKLLQQVKGMLIVVRNCTGFSQGKYFRERALVIR